MHSCSLFVRAPLRLFRTQLIKMFIRQQKKNRSWRTVLSCQALSLADYRSCLSWNECIMNRLWYEHSSQLDRTLNNCSVMRQTYLDSSWWRIANLIEEKQLSETFRFIFRRLGSIVETEGQITTLLGFTTWHLKISHFFMMFIAVINI